MSPQRNKLNTNQSLVFFSDECQTCDCVSQFMGKTGVYGIVIGGDPKNIYCSFEGRYTWTVRKAMALKYNGVFFL